MLRTVCSLPGIISAVVLLHAPLAVCAEGMPEGDLTAVEKDMLVLIDFDGSVAARTSWGAVVRGDFGRNTLAARWDGETVPRGMPRFLKGKFGRGIYLERGATNFFRENQSSVEADAAGFTALGNGKLSRSTAHHWQGAASLEVHAGTGGGVETEEISTHTVPIHGHERVRIFTASVFLKGDRGGEKVSLRLSDVASLQEAAPKVYAELTQREKGAKGTESDPLTEDAKSPFAPKSEEQHVTLAREWQRYYTRVHVPRERTRHRLRFRITSDDPTRIRFFADGFQLEQSGQYPHHHVATTWVRGRTARSAETLTFPLDRIRFPEERGAISIWVNPRSWWGWNEVRSAALFSIGAPNKPVWVLPLSYRVTVKGGSRHFNVRRRPAANEFHHFLLNWDDRVFQLFIDGQLNVSGEVGSKPITTRLLHVGLNCSNLQNANAVIDELAIFRRPLTSGEVEAIHKSRRPLWLKSSLALEALQNRSAFFRDEAKAALRFRARHSPERQAPGVRAELLEAGRPLPGLAAELKPDSAGIATFELSPRSLRAGEYSLRLKLGDANESTSYSFPVTVVPALNPHQYLTQFWQGPTDEHNLATFERMGLAVLDTTRWASDRTLLDRLARRGIRLCAHVGTLRPFSSLLHPEACIVTQDGTGTKRLCANHPAVIDAATKDVRHWAGTLRPYPHVRFCLLNSEVGNPPCFGESCMGRMKAELGFTWPERLRVGSGSRILFNAKAEPSPHVVDGVVQDDDPYYLTFKWRHGPGSLSPHHRAVVAALKEVIDAQVVHDPAFRLPWVHTRFDGVDVVQHWNYSPALPEILLHIKALLCAARGRKPASMILGMVWPRAYYKRDGRRWSAAQSPDYLRESMWLVLSQPVDILSFWAWKGASPPGHEASYREVERMFTDIVVPYGPAIRKMKAVPSSAATLYSTCSQLFYQYPWYFTWGYTRVFNQTLLKHNVPLDVVYEQDLLDGALARYETLFLPVNVALPASVHQRIVRFAQRGGLVVADRFLKASIPGVHQLDIHLGTPHYLAPVKTIAERVSAYCPEIKNRLRPYVDTPTPDVLVAAKEHGGARYIFVINDKRHAGKSMDYTGDPRLAEKYLPDGLAQDAEIVIRTQPAPVIYDVLSHKVVPSRQAGDTVKLSLSLGPSEGKMLAVYPSRIDKAQLAIDGDLRPGGNLRLTATVLSAEGQPMPGTQSLRVDIADSRGRGNDYSDYYATDRGLFRMEIPIAVNEPAGTWQVTVRELTTGLSATREAKLR